MEILHEWFYDEYKFKSKYGYDYIEEPARKMGVKNGDVVQEVIYENGLRKCRLIPRYAAEVRQLAERLMDDIQKVRPDLFGGCGFGMIFCRIRYITICEIRVKNTGDLYGCGVAFCGKNDQHDEVVGEALALSRALGLDKHKDFCYLEDFLNERKANAYEDCRSLVLH